MGDQETIERNSEGHEYKESLAEGRGQVNLYMHCHLKFMLYLRGSVVLRSGCGLQERSQ